MQSHSILINYIIDNLGTNFTQEQIKLLFKDLNVKVKFNNNLAIFNYNIGADFNNKIVRECRGIIIDLNNFQVVCWPFTKFGNYYESYADDIDWSTAIVQEKIDGSICKLYWYDHEWHWATNSCINASEAIIQNSNRTFQDIIYSAINYNAIDLNKLEKTKTYIFELVSPENKVVIDYDFPFLYHIGTRSNLTGIEYKNFIGIAWPRTYNLDNYSLENVLKEVEKFNDDDGCEHEGFVVCDANYHRIKVKNLKYLKLHYNLTRNSISKKDIVKALIFNDEESIETFKSYPKFLVRVKFYDWQVTKFLYELDIYIKGIRDLYLSLGQNRKDFAMSVSNDKFKSFAFIAIDHMDKTTEELVKSLNFNKILNYIDDAE